MRLKSSFDRHGIILRFSDTESDVPVLIDPCHSRIRELEVGLAPVVDRGKVRRLGFRRPEQHLVLLLPLLPLHLDLHHDVVPVQIIVQLLLEPGAYEFGHQQV